MGTIAKERERLKITKPLVRVQVKPTDTATWYKRMKDLGIIDEATIVVDTIKKEKYDGGVLIASRKDHEEGSVGLTLGEDLISESYLMFGSGVLSAVDAVAEQSETEYLWLYKLIPESMIPDDDATVTVSSATTDETTPQTIVEDTDFEFTTKRGCLAVKAISTSLILNETNFPPEDYPYGYPIILTYTWDKPAQRVLQVGGDMATNNELLVELVSDNPNGQRDIYQLITDPSAKISKGFTGEFTSNQTTLKLLANETLAEGRQLYKEIQEQSR